FLEELPFLEDPFPSQDPNQRLHRLERRGGVRVGIAGCVVAACMVAGRGKVPARFARDAGRGSFRGNVGRRGLEVRTHVRMAEPPLGALAFSLRSPSLRSPSAVLELLRLLSEAQQFARAQVALTGLSKGAGLFEVLRKVAPDR